MPLRRTVTSASSPVQDNAGIDAVFAAIHKRAPALPPALAVDVVQRIRLFSPTAEDNHRAAFAGGKVDHHGVVARLPDEPHREFIAAIRLSRGEQSAGPDTRKKDAYGWPPNRR